MKIRAVNSSKHLLKVVKNPVTDHLPKNINIFAISKDGEKTNIKGLLKKTWEDQNSIAFAVSCGVKESQKWKNYQSKNIKITNFGGSVSRTLVKVIVAGEEYLKIDEL